MAKPITSLMCQARHFCTTPFTHEALLVTDFGLVCEACKTGLEATATLLRSTEVEMFATAMGHGRNEYDRDIEDRARGERY